MASPLGGRRATGGGRRVTTVARNQWQSVKNRSTVTGKMIFYCLIVTVLALYSVVLVKVATKSAVDEMSARAGAGVHGPGRLMYDDDRFRRGEMGGMDDFNAGGVPDDPLVDCTWPDLSGGADDTSSSGAGGSASRAQGCFKDSNGKAIACGFDDLIVDPTKLSMKAKGGEELSSVMGQDEEDEFVQRIEDGAFLLKPSVQVPSIADLVYTGGYADEENLFYLRPVVASMKARAEGEGTDVCRAGGGHVVETPTLFLTRYEYVNLKATIADLFNAYGVSLGAIEEGREQNAKNEKFNVVFLDGHPRGSFDDVWPALFGGTVAHVKDMGRLLSPPAKTGSSSGPTCFRRAIFVPAGYMAPILHWSCNAVPSMLSSFVSHVLRTYDLTETKRRKRKILIIDRVGYVSHPRSDPKKATRVISNLDELKRTIETAVGSDAEVELIRPESMKSYRDQIESVRSAEVLIGKYGSGLANMILMDDDTLSIELDPLSYNTYQGFSDWSGDGHTHLQIETNIAAEEDRGELDQPSMDRIAAAVKTKVNCNLWEGNTLSASYGDLQCKKKEEDAADGSAGDAGGGAVD